MATTIITKNGSGAPVAGNLTEGELALDLTNKKLYSKQGSTVFEVGATGGGASGTFTDLTATSSFTSPGIDDNADATAITIDASENVGIGTGAPAALLHVNGSFRQTGATAPFQWDVAAGAIDRYTLSSPGFAGNILTANASGNVGIGTSSPSAKLEVAGNIGFGTGGTFAAGQLYSDANWGVILRAKQASPAIAEFAFLNADGIERMRIDSVGNMYVGAAAGTKLVVSNTGSWSSPTTVANFYGTGDYQCTIGVNSSFGVDIGRHSTTGIIDFNCLQNSIDAFSWSQAGTERMRLNASGNLLVGKTSNSFTIAGVRVRGDFPGIIEAASANSMLVLNRLTTDGDMATLYKDGTTVGSIGVASSELYFSSGNTGLYFDDANNLIRPTNSAGALRDNIVDLGASNSRFDDIYATNGTIQTSDANEKQDIEALSEAETRVAVAAKGLLRKFRWKSAVEEKGDDARVHFGIIAQDLKAAFEAEGLDAGRYAMFIHSTWTDEETGEERSRMGVRYSELLAFIIAAI